MLERITQHSHCQPHTWECDSIVQNVSMILPWQLGLTGSCCFQQENGPPWVCSATAKPCMGMHALLQVQSQWCIREKWVILQSTKPPMVKMPKSSLQTLVHKPVILFYKAKIYLHMNAWQHLLSHQVRIQYCRVKNKPKSCVNPRNGCVGKFQ